MSDLIIDNYLIDEPIINILYKLRDELTNGKLNVIEQKDDYVRVTCPVHAGGTEKHPSCSVYCGNGELQYGWYHCFTCSSSGPLYKFIGECFGQSANYGRQWLLNNFGNTYITDRELQLEDIELNTVVKEEKEYLDESVLEEFSSYHPYMTKRKLTDEVIEKFEIKYDPLSKSIVFPVRDINGKIAFLTRRSTEGKKFIIDKGADKSVIYLLYNNINEREVYVVESQINALTLESWGYHAIALFGAGTSEGQMKTLNNTNIKRYILCYDNDQAGRKGAKRFKKLIRKDVFVDDIIMPEGKDVNDLTKEEFDNLVYKSLN